MAAQRALLSERAIFANRQRVSRMWRDFDMRWVLRAAAAAAAAAATAAAAASAATSSSAPSSAPTHPSAARRPSTACRWRTSDGNGLPVLDAGGGAHARFRAWAAVQ